jgi:CheY-like chemotaxis protein
MRRVREYEHRNGRERTPAAALTAYSTAQDRKDALLAGFNIHLTKPVDLDELAMVVLSLAGKVAPP